VLHLRELHEALDRAVLEAYGWSDIAVPPLCPKSDTERALLESFQDEVIDRLYLLNAERAKYEESRGLGKKKPALAKPKKLKGAKVASAVRGLFEK